MFANYSLVEEEQKVSRIAAVYSSESLLFVVGNKVCTFILYSSKAYQLISSEFNVLKYIDWKWLICQTLFILYAQLINVSPRGPGCAHFLNCSVCLAAPKFMGCGWCDGVCSQMHQCKDQWSSNSCPPVITQVTLHNWAINVTINCLSFKFAFLNIQWVYW